MPTVRKILAGQKSKSTGDQFENILRNSAQMRGWKVTKHPSGCKRVWTPGGVLTKDVPTEFDFTFARNGVAIFADAKMVSRNFFSFAMIKQHQVLALREYEKQGFRSGYVVCFKDLNQVVFFSATQLMNLKPRQSLETMDGILLGNNQFVSLESIATLLR